MEVPAADAAVLRNLRLDEYELVLSSSHVCDASRSPTGVLHVCYCHTPVRYAWIAPGRETASGVAGVGLRGLGPYLRRLDLRAAAYPDSFVANSTAVQGGSTAFLRPGLGRHPPAGRRRPVHGHCRRADGVPVGAAAGAAQAAGGRGGALQRLPHRLTMVGEGMLELPALLAARERPPVQVAAACRPHRPLRARRGFIHIGERTSASAWSSWRRVPPVIAVDQGGARDIVRPDVDGVLLEAPEPRALGKPWRQSPHARGTAGLWPSVPASSRASASSSGSAVTSPSSAFR